MNDVKNRYNSRSTYSKQQQQVLWHYFDKNDASKQNLNNAVKEEISRATNISVKSIHSWFQYQRKMKREAQAKGGLKSETSIDVDAFEPNSQMNASIVAKIQKYDALKSQVDFLLQQVEILKKDLDVSKRDLEESNISLNDSGFDTSNNSFNNSSNGQHLSSQATLRLQYNSQNQNISQNLSNVQRFGFQSQPNGPNNLSNGAQNIAGGIYNQPNYVQNQPNGAQNMPNGAQNLPNGVQNMPPNGSRTLPNGSQNMANGSQNLPNGPQNMANGMVYNMGYNMNPMFYSQPQPQQYQNHLNQMHFNGSVVKQEPPSYNMDQTSFIKAEPQ